MDPFALPEAPTGRLSLLRVVVGLCAAVIFAVVLAQPWVRRLERKLGLSVLVSSGIPFVFLGVLFRYERVGILTEDVMADLRPVLEFGLGWLGFVVGLKFDVRVLEQMPERSGVVVFFEALIPAVATAAFCSVMLVLLDPSFTEARDIPFLARAVWIFERTSLRDALALGASAVAAAPVAAAAIAREGGSRSAALVGKITALSDVAGVLVLGAVCASFRPTDAVSAWKLPHIAWTLIILGLGGVFGILTYLLSRSAKSVSEEVAYLLGSVAVSSGMSGYLGISPLVPCALAGALIANLPLRSGAVLQKSIALLERPLYLVFLLIAGALWDVSLWQGWVLVPLFVFVRIVAKGLAAVLAKRFGPADLPDTVTLGLALSPQSPIAIAVIVSYVTLYRPLSGTATSLPWLMTAVVGGAMMTELSVQAIVRLRGGLRFEAQNASVVSIPPPGDEP